MSADDALPDWEDARDQLGGSEELLLAVAETFLDSCPEMMEAIRRSAAEGDPAELRRAAHTLKGSVAVFGARPARDAAGSLENLAREGALEGAPDAIARVEVEIEHLVPALRRRLDS